MHNNKNLYTHLKPPMHWSISYPRTASSRHDEETILTSRLVIDERRLRTWSSCLIWKMGPYIVIQANRQIALPTLFMCKLYWRVNHQVDCISPHTLCMNFHPGGGGKTSTTATTPAASKKKDFSSTKLVFLSKQALQCIRPLFCHVLIYYSCHQWQTLTRWKTSIFLVGCFITMHDGQYVRLEAVNQRVAKNRWQ